MKKFLFVSTLLLLFTTMAVFCQEASDSIKDALTDLGMSQSFALIVSLVFTTVVLQAIPQKWAGPTSWAKKIAYLLYMLLDKIDKKINNVSASQRQESLKQQELKLMLQDEQEKIMPKIGAKKPILTVALLLVGITFLNAQSPWNGFFDPVSQAVNQSYLMKADGESSGEGVFKFRTSFSLTALAIDLSEQAPVATSLSAAGLGLSYGKYITTSDDKPYCKYSINAAFLTKMQFGESTDAKLGISVTGDVFNKILGVGPGVYFDAGKPKWLLLFNVAVPL